MHPPRSRRSAAGTILVWLSLLAASPAQSIDRSEPSPERLEAIARAWVAAFDAGRLDPSGNVEPSRTTRLVYGDDYAPGGFLVVSGVRSAWHLGLLHRVLFLAENRPSEYSALAALHVASAGFERSLNDSTSRELRELGRWTITRMNTPIAWSTVARVAAGRPVVPDADGRPTVPRAALRVAALRVLGDREDVGAAEALEAAIGADDPRIRLAAAESLERRGSRECLRALATALAREPHPIVAQSLVRSVAAGLNGDGRRWVDDETARAAVSAALRRIGEAGWRTDLAIVELAEKNPSLDSIPLLIEVMDGRIGSSDELLEVVNESASPILRQRAWQTLRRLTGAILPLDDSAAWRRFWSEEQDRIRLPDDPAESDARVKTQSSFFGIPIIGREVVFVIDTSGSMDDPVQGRFKDASGRAIRGISTRLRVAKEQVLFATQGLADNARYHLMTFDDDVARWNDSGIRPSRQSHRDLTAILDRLRAGGGTDLFAALMAALCADEVVFGQQPENPVDEVFLLSDGRPTQGDVQDWEEILARVAEINRYQRVRIHAVHIGGGAGADLLKKLAAANDGVFVARD